MDPSPMAVLSKLSICPQRCKPRMRSHISAQRKKATDRNPYHGHHKYICRTIDSQASEFTVYFSEHNAMSI